MRFAIAVQKVAVYWLFGHFTRRRLVSDEINQNTQIILKTLENH